jgi:glycosyltransferase involved in cell wall biosynthesis
LKNITKTATPLLSIITVNRNNEIGLNKTFRSIIEQTQKNYELIVIDGNSTDKSIDIIKQYYENITYWISEPDEGVYCAMNKGITKAKGEYCFFLNSGDYFANDSVLKNVFRNEPTADVIYGNLIVISENKVSGIIKGKEHNTFLDIYSSQIKHQSSFIKRDLFAKFGLYDESLKISADWAFFIKSIGLNSASLKYVDIDIACFDNNGLSNNNPELCETERQIIIDQFIPEIMRKDYILLKKYKDIRYIDLSKFGWFLFRGLAKTLKILLPKRNL